MRSYVSLEKHLDGAEVDGRTQDNMRMDHLQHPLVLHGPTFAFFNALEDKIWDKDTYFWLLVLNSLVFFMVSS